MVGCGHLRHEAERISEDVGAISNSSGVGQGCSDPFRTRPSGYSGKVKRNYFLPVYILGFEVRSMCQLHVEAPTTWYTITNVVIQKRTCKTG